MDLCWSFTEQHKGGNDICDSFYCTCSDCGDGFPKTPQIWVLSTIVRLCTCSFVWYFTFALQSHRTAAKDVRVCLRGLRWFNNNNNLYLVNEFWTLMRFTTVVVLWYLELSTLCNAGVNICFIRHWQNVFCWGILVFCKMCTFALWAFIRVLTLSWVFTHVHKRSPS